MSQVWPGGWEGGDSSSQRKYLGRVAASAAEARSRRYVIRDTTLAVGVGEVWFPPSLTHPTHRHVGFCSVNAVNSENVRKDYLKYTLHPRAGFAGQYGRYTVVVPENVFAAGKRRIFS